MAVGDVLYTKSVALAAAGTFTRQPTSGVEEAVMAVFGGNSGAAAPNDTIDITIEMFDGTDAYQWTTENMAVVFARGGPYFGITNTNYFRGTNTNASAKNMAVQTVQSK